MNINYSFFFRKPFDSVSQHSTWHFHVSGPKPRLQSRFVPLPSLAEQPTHGLMYKVVLMMQEDISNFKSILKLAMADKSHSAYNSDTLLPDGFAAPGQVI